MTEIANRELVVYALALLGGESRRVHTEDIAVKCHELFPGSFSWTKYTNLPDKDLVRVALVDARKVRWGALVEGRAGQHRGQTAKTHRRPEPDGWTLTAAGIHWVSENQQRFAFHGSADSKALRPRQLILKQLTKITRHPLFLTFLQSPTTFAPAIGEIADFLRCRVDAPDAVWARRFYDCERLAAATENSAVSEFLMRCNAAQKVQK